MTVIRIDPPQLDEMASLLDSTAGEYDSLAGMLASPDLGSMPANVAGIVGQAYAEARATSTSLAGEFCAEARTLRFRCVTAAEQGGLACQLGSLGSLGFAAGLGSAFLSPYGAAGVGGALSAAWGGVVVGSQSASSAASGLGFGGSSFTPGSTVAGGSVFTVGGSNPFILGGAPSSAVTTITIGGDPGPGYSFVMPNPLGAVASPGGGATLMVGGNAGPGYSNVMTLSGAAAGGGTTFMVGGGAGPGYSNVTTLAGAASGGGNTVLIGGDQPGGVVVNISDPISELLPYIRPSDQGSDALMNEILLQGMVPGMLRNIFRTQDQTLASLMTPTGYDWEPNPFGSGPLGSYVSNPSMPYDRYDVG